MISSRVKFVEVTFQLQLLSTIFYALMLTMDRHFTPSPS